MIDSITTKEIIKVLIIMITETNLIKDFNSLEKFIRATIMKNPLHKDEVYIILGIARKKYDSTLSMTSQILVQRKIIRQVEYLLIQTQIQKVDACMHLAYDNGQKIPLGACALYIDLNPRSYIKALPKFFNEMTNFTYEALYNPEFNFDIFKNADSKLFSALHASTSKKYYQLLDLDCKDIDKVESIINILGKEIVWKSETRGGYHFIVHKTHENSKIIHEQLKSMNKLEIQKACLTPIVGTLQGGFLVKEVTGG